MTEGPKILRYSEMQKSSHVRSNPPSETIYLSWSYILIKTFSDLWNLETIALQAWNN